MQNWCRVLSCLIGAGMFVTVVSVMTANAGTTHIYTGGSIQDISQDQLVVGANRYTVSPSVKIIILNKRNGSYYEDAGRRSDLQTGQPVRLKVEGTTVYEVVIERWKQ